METRSGSDNDKHKKHHNYTLDKVQKQPHDLFCKKSCS